MYREEKEHIGNRNSGSFTPRILKKQEKPISQKNARIFKK
jgi:hypothetical protein